jgi:Mn-dependent DtxR family transcriptional regulator
MKQSRSVEDFLEALLMLEEKKEPLETTKVAETFSSVSKPAVHQMGHELISQGVHHPARLWGYGLDSNRAEISDRGLPSPQSFESLSFGDRSL